MSHVLFDDPCILFALRRESAPFCREFRPNQAFPGAPCRARFCGPSWLPVLVVETGMGQANVGLALDWLLSKPKFDKVGYQPKLILYAGFAGALNDTLQIGDIVLAEEVVDMHGQRWRTTWPARSMEGRWVPPLHLGRLLTVEQMIAKPKEKQRLGTLHQANAVDMESALFAARCTTAGIPFGCVRAISDCLTDELSPKLVSLLSGGAVSPWRVLGGLVRHPGMAPELLRLAGDTRVASRQLGLALGELLTLTLPWDL